MGKNFTSNHLIRYAYNETNLLETTLITKTIESDPIAAAKYAHILQMMGFLDQVSIEPSAQSLDKILKYLHTPQKEMQVS